MQVTLLRVLVVLGAGLISPAIAQTTTPSTGVWRFNPSPPPKQQVAPSTGVWKFNPAPSEKQPAAPSVDVWKFNPGAAKSANCEDLQATIDKSVKQIDAECEGTKYAKHLQKCITIIQQQISDMKRAIPHEEICQIKTRYGLGVGIRRLQAALATIQEYAQSLRGDQLRQSSGSAGNNSETGNSRCRERWVTDLCQQCGYSPGAGNDCIAVQCNGRVVCD